MMLDVVDRGLVGEGQDGLGRQLGKLELDLISQPRAVLGPVHTHNLMTLLVCFCGDAIVGGAKRRVETYSVNRR